MTVLQSAGQLGLAVLFVCLLLAQQPPPPKPPPPPSIPARLADIKRRLNGTRAVNAAAARALQLSRDYLATAQQAFAADQVFAADRLAAAADSLLRIAEHQQHIRAGGGPKGPPPPEQIRDHLERVYFRVQQADYFLEQSHDKRASSFPKWARDFYQQALRAYDHRDFVAADGNAKCAEGVVKTLESLAQAAAPAVVPPPPPPPPPRPPV